MAGGLPTGGLEGRACLRKEVLYPPSLTPPEVESWAPCVALHGTVLTQPSILSVFCLSPILTKDSTGCSGGFPQGQCESGLHQLT